MKKLLPLISIAVIAVVLAAWFLTGNSGGQKPPAAAGGLRRFVAAEGKVEALPGLQVDVGSEIIGRIDRFHVKEGDTVEAGTVLARLDSSDARARLAEAEAELKVAEARLLEVESGSRVEEVKRARASVDAAMAEAELAKKNLVRHRDLYKNGFIPEHQLEEKVSAFKVAKARLNERREELALLEKGAKAETIGFYREGVGRAAAAVASSRAVLEKSVIRSPISGKVLRKLMEEGETIIPEFPMLTVADVERAWVNAEVDETDIGKVFVGDEADITSDAYPGVVYRGTVTEIADYVGERKVKPNNTAKNLDMKVVQVKLTLKDKTPLRLGMTVDVRITPGGKKR